MSQTKKGLLARNSTWRNCCVTAGLLTFAMGIQGQTQAQGSSGGQFREARASNSSEASGGVENPAPRMGNSYVIGVGDILSVNVWNEPDVTGKVPVRPDGMITMPLIGEIQASGVTPDKLQATIAQKLSEFVKQPSVTVVVEEMKSRGYNVMGEVQHPGLFTLDKPTRVLDALAQAGGFGDFAKTGKVYVLRRNPNGSTQKFPFNYKRVSQGRDIETNIELQPGDTVIVP